MFNGACPRSFPCLYTDSPGRRFGALLSFYTLTCQKASFYDLQLFISGLALNLVGLGNSDQKDIFYGRFSELQLSDSLERLGFLTSAGSPTADKRWKTLFNWFSRSQSDPSLIHFFRPTLLSFFFFNLIKIKWKKNVRCALGFFHVVASEFPNCSVLDLSRSFNLKDETITIHIVLILNLKKKSQINIWKELCCFNVNRFDPIIFFY